MLTKEKGQTLTEEFTAAVVTSYSAKVSTTSMQRKLSMVPSVNNRIAMCHPCLVQTQKVICSNVKLMVST